MKVEMEVQSFKWVRRGNVIHAGKTGDAVSFCGVELLRLKNSSMLEGAVEWCSRCVAQTRDRHAVPTK